MDAYGGQVDLAPTLLGLLGIGYVQNDFGVDLLKEKRPYMYFTADNLIGVRDSSRLFLYFPDTQQEIRYRTEGMTVQTAEDDPVFRDMKQYGFAMLQCAEVLVQRQQTLNHPHGGQAVESSSGDLLTGLDILSKSQIQAYENGVFAALLDNRCKYAILACLPINKSQPVPGPAFIRHLACPTVHIPMETRQHPQGYHGKTTHG